MSAPGRFRRLAGPRVSRVLDAVLVLAAVGLHLLGCSWLNILPPFGALETGLLVLPLLAQAAALGLVIVRNDRTGISLACLFQWLVVLYLLPSGLQAFEFAPAAIVLSLALLRPREA